ncbi:type II secretion system protein [Desulfothermobacter acidiphilus]|uniref:type II secretion system protein n=1 Tax=Desulfothermobacter acidiphilus TaxID=1938353 RepID=UPI003F8B6693
MKEKLRKVFRRLKGQGGFTLIELLIVIAIMGFLVAMIAPRLAKVAGNASDVVCDNNQARLRQVLAAYTEGHGTLPDRLTSLVCHDDTGVAVDPTTQYDFATELGTGWYIDDNNKGTGQEVLSKDFYAMTKMGLVKLSPDEAKELQQLGVNTIFYLNVNQDVKAMDYVSNEIKKFNANIPKHGAGKNDYMAVTPVSAGVEVLAAGYKNDGTTAALTIQPNQKIGHPDWVGRILLGVGPESDLVKEGLIQQAGMCPNGIKRSDHFLYNNYNIVVPRLASTATAMVTALANDPAAIGVKLTFKNERTGETKDVEIYKDQGEEVWQVTTCCPEGCNPMAVSEPVWVLTGPPAAIK